MDCSPPDSSVHGISQARILDWVAISFSRGSSWPRNQTHILCIGRQILNPWDTREACYIWLPRSKSLNSAHIQGEENQSTSCQDRMVKECLDTFYNYHTLHPQVSGEVTSPPGRCLWPWNMKLGFKVTLWPFYHTLCPPLSPHFAELSVSTPIFKINKYIWKCLKDRNGVFIVIFPLSVIELGSEKVLKVLIKVWTQLCE